eukprot:gene4703-5875_t
MKLKVGIGFSVVVLVGCIIGFALPWYQIKQKGNFKLDVDFKWKNYVCKRPDVDDKSFEYDEINLIGCLPLMIDEYKNVEKIMSTCLTFLTIGAAVSLGTILLQIIILLSPKLCRSCIWKVLCIGTAIAAVVLLFISFFTFLGLPKAFKDDYNLVSYNTFCEDRWCDKILGDDDNYRWIPGGGWWAVLAACFFAFVGGVFTLASQR